jgi:hypothetical protein
MNFYQSVIKALVPFHRASLCSVARSYLSRVRMSLCWSLFAALLGAVSLGANAQGVATPRLVPIEMYWMLSVWGWEEGRHFPTLSAAVDAGRAAVEAGRPNPTRFFHDPHPSV